MDRWRWLAGVSVEYKGFLGIRLGWISRSKIIFMDWRSEDLVRNC
jgi:hypothetical protein